MIDSFYEALDKIGEKHPWIVMFLPFMWLLALGYILSGDPQEEVQ